MKRWMGILKVRPGEERISVLLVGLMLFVAIGSAVGGSATEALFFARYGLDLLPMMYILLGLVTFGASLAITALMGRMEKQRLYASLPLLLGFLLIGERLVILLNMPWFFALMWLGMNVINSLLTLLTWGLAGMACDTRQAKRLFPLFSAGAILGTVLGGLITPLLAAWLHAENLLLIWAATMFVTFGLSRALAGHTPVVRAAASHSPQPGIVEEMQRGYQFVRSSPIMQWVSFSAILFSICFFSLALPFSRGAAVQFPNADQLTGFLGLFRSVYTGAALLAAVFLTNRLFAKFGILPMLLVYPLIYLAGFGMMTVTSAAGISSASNAVAANVTAFPAAFTLLVLFRFAQMAYMDGIANASWQALFNVVPPEQRDQVRAFVGGVPEQAGTLIAGLVLFIGDRALQPEQLYLIGFAAAALTFYLIWRASRAYGQAMVTALRAGQPQVFVIEHRHLPGSTSNAARLDPAPLDSWAVSIVIRGLNDPDPGVRRASAEIVSQITVPEATQALIHALTDEDPQVKVAALKGLASARAAQALLEVSASLSDPDADVRFQAIDTLRQLAAYPRGITLHVEPLLVDPDPSVRAEAAKALLCATHHAGARETLHNMVVDANPRVHALALDALGECQDETAWSVAASALDHAQPVVRRAAVRALAAVNPQAAQQALIRHLSDDDRSVRSTLAEAFGRIGEQALEPLVDALADPTCEEGALQALEYLPVKKAEQRLRAYISGVTRTALRYHHLAFALAQKYGHLTEGDGRLQLLFDSLEDQGQRSGLNALRGLCLLNPGKRAAVEAAVESLRSPSAVQHANALETLETVGEQQLVRPLLALWESTEATSISLPESWLRNLLDDPNAWVRACAVLVAPQFFPDARLHQKLNTLSSSDPDEIVRVTAEHLLSGETKMETLPTLSTMERVLFLRRVPLFMDLPPAELKQVAAIASEVLFADQQALANQGEMGVELYIIITGEVRVLVTTETQKEAREVARRRSGDYVGEMAVIGQEPRMATLVANGPVRVLCIKQKEFESILRERPEISLAMMRILSQRLREATQAAVVG